MKTLLRDERLAVLSRELRSGEGECPIVVRPPHDATTKLAHFSAGRDATYVVIEAAKSAIITIGYAAFIEGTTLIYDVTDQALQGKARPFECELQPGTQRVYAVLPVQIEAVRIARRGNQVAVEFHDARGERIEAALPFQLTLTSTSGKKRVAYSCTNRDGQFVRGLADVDGDELLSVCVGSLLTGREELVQLRR